MSISLSLEQFKTLSRSKIESNAVMTDDEFTGLKAELRATIMQRFSDDKLDYFLISFARYCSDNGSSIQAQYKGVIVHAGSTISRAALSKAIIKQGITLRQFCMKFAKIVYTLHRMSGNPPARWQKAGYVDSTKFAGFDFFAGVTHEAAIDPPTDWPTFTPTPDELTASEAARTVTIERSRLQQGTNLTNHTPVTSGKVTRSIGLIMAPQAN